MRGRRNKDRMLYVQQSLAPNEELVHIGRFHWIYTFNAFMAIFWGICGSVVAIAGSVFMSMKLHLIPAETGWLEAVGQVHPGLRILSFLIFILGLLSFARMMVNKATTEIAVTSTRLIFKRGLIARQVGEMSIDRIEGVNILQSIMGRVFNYGRLAVRGMGIGEVILPPIEDPIAFRQAIEKAGHYDECTIPDRRSHTEKKPGLTKSSSSPVKRFWPAPPSMTGYTGGRSRCSSSP